MDIIQHSLMVIDNQIVYKYDHIATIYIDGRYYFNVFRRYNSDYNIMIQDYNGDIYLHQNNTVQQSIDSVLCVKSNMYTVNATSYLHNGHVPTLEISDMKWTDIHTKYQTVSANLSGVFDTDIVLDIL